jgi:putative transposase
VGQSLKGVDVRDELGRIVAKEQVLPHRLQCDNGSEFISKDVDQWK